MTKYREILRLKSLDSVKEHRTELRCIQKHSRQGFEKGSGNQSFMAAGFRHDRQRTRGADVS